MEASIALCDNDENDSNKLSVKPKQKKLDKSIFGKCKICNDKATGIHYGVATCEGCKVEFLHG